MKQGSKARGRAFVVRLLCMGGVAFGEQKEAGGRPRWRRRPLARRSFVSERTNAVAYVPI